MEEKNVQSFDIKEELGAVVDAIKEATAKINETKEVQVKKFDLTNEAVAEVGVQEAKKLESLKFIKALGEGDRKTLKFMSGARAKALNEGTGSAGGFLVPEEFEKSIVKYMEQYSQIRSNATVLSMGSDVKRLNALSGEPTVYKVGELAQITGTALVFAEPVLTAEKYAGIIDWSSEVVEDSELDLVNLVAERIARAIAKKEQESFISSAVSGSEGLLTVSGVTAKTIASGTGFSNITWDDLATMMTALDEIDLEDGANAKFYMSSSVYNVLRVLKASTSGEYFLPVSPSMDNPAMAWGKEIVLCNQMPKVSATASGTKFVVYTDLKRHGFVGDRRGLAVKLLEEGTVGSVNLAEDDAQALRITKRTAWTTALQTGIVTLATN